MIASRRLGLARLACPSDTLRMLMLMLTSANHSMSQSYSYKQEIHFWCCIARAYDERVE